MANATRKKPIAKTVLLGLASAGLYALAFSNADAMLSTFTKGGLYSALPIATVLVFSFVHGSFAGNLWTCLGINAKQKVKRTEAVKRPAVDNRPRISAQQA